MQYTVPNFIYPPRAKVRINPLNICRYANGNWIAQPKYNGSHCVIITNGREVHFYSREGEKKHPDKYKGIDLRGIHSGNGWMVVGGELMDKAKLDEHGNKLTGFVIHEILVYGGKYLVGSTLQERLDLMTNLWPDQNMKVQPNGSLLQYDHLSFTETEGVYRTMIYQGYFDVLYREIVKVDAYEGLLFKKLDAKLDFGGNESNNHQWQVKARKPTKNYQY